MGIFDRAKEALSGHSEQVEAVIDRAGDFLDEKTEGKYAEQVDKGQEMARDKLADLTPDEPERPA
ncbi:MAG: antitoxin [Propionibacteriaceae bacterium]